MKASARVVVLAGGVGGARLVDGLHHVLPPGALQVIVNTGDDFEHWGLHISPDLDTITYTLAGLAPEDRGWGIREDTFCALEEARRRGLEDWFQLGDRDLVTHLTRSAALATGKSLTEITHALCATLGVNRTILPMSNEPRPTTVITSDGERLAFQRWLVEARAAPKVRAVRFEGSNRPTSQALDAIDRAELIVIGPSNPYVSIDPILTLQGVREALRDKTTVAVSPIVNGKAVKGPLAAMIPPLSGLDPSARAVAAHYEGLLNGFAVQQSDRFDAPFPILETNILIQSHPDRVRFARELLKFARSLK